MHDRVETYNKSEVTFKSAKDVYVTSLSILIGNFTSRNTTVYVGTVHNFTEIYIKMANMKIIINSNSIQILTIGYG